MDYLTGQSSRAVQLPSDYDAESAVSGMITLTDINYIVVVVVFSQIKVVTFSDIIQRQKLQSITTFSHGHCISTSTKHYNVNYAKQVQGTHWLQDKTFQQYHTCFSITAVCMIFLRSGITRPRKAAEVIGHEVIRANGQVIKIGEDRVIGGNFHIQKLGLVLFGR